MRNPILQEKRQEHVTFQKYALELLESLSGKAKQAGQDSEVSLVNIHRVSKLFFEESLKLCLLLFGLHFTFYCIKLKISLLLLQANVVAQTKIHFNDKQLLQLIHHHLTTKGYTEAASVLQKEANVDNSLFFSNTMHPLPKFSYIEPVTPTRVSLPEATLFN